MSKKERLEKNKELLEKRRSCLNEKLEKLHKQRDLETRTEERLRLKDVISEVETDIANIDTLLEKVESELKVMQATEIAVFNKKICLNPQFEKYLVDTEVTFQHRYKDNILLSDIYVSPSS